MTFNEILAVPPYSLNEREKEKLLTKRLVELTKLHQENCPEYKRILESIDFKVESAASYKVLPFLPVHLLAVRLLLPGLLHSHDAYIPQAVLPAGSALYHMYFSSAFFEALSQTPHPSGAFPEKKQETAHRLLFRCGFQIKYAGRLYKR